MPVENSARINFVGDLRFSVTWSSEPVQERSTITPFSFLTSGFALVDRTHAKLERF